MTWTKQFAWLAFLSVLVMGCTKAREPVPRSDDDKLGPSSQGNGIGQDCGTDSDCRPGLTCGGTGTCSAAGTQSLNQSCVITAECVEDSYCEPLARRCFNEATVFIGDPCDTDDDCGGPLNPELKCTSNGDIAGNPYVTLPIYAECKEAGDTVEGGLCSADGDCLAGLFCEYIGGFSGVCQTAGDVDWSGLCNSSADCHAGLICGAKNQCASLYDVANADAWQGTSCAADEGTVRAYFEVPEAGVAGNDFYRLPFPNDIRAESNHWATGHPTSGVGVLPYDLTARYQEAIAENMVGWGSTPTVYFRFSAELDYESINASVESGEKEVGKDGRNILFLNIEAESEKYGRDVGYTWGASSGDGKYICRNWLSMDISAGNPLEPGSTYAAILMKGVLSSSGDAVEYESDSDFQKMLQDSAPKEPRLASAWQRYEKLRAFFADKGVSSEAVLNAAVFTVGKSQHAMSVAREAVRESSDEPVVTELTLCKEGTVSPCEEGDVKRACAFDSEFEELHGKIKLPIFQNGTAPYLSPADGGDLNWVNDTLALVRHEEVCFSLTIPKTQMPPTGWPLVLYGHDTGGNYRSHASNGIASTVAKNASAAVLSIDAVANGTRRGSSDYDSRVLFHHYGNPKSARGNVQQGAIDYFSLVQMAEGFSQDVGLGTTTSFDLKKIAYLGRGQGATTGILFAAYEPLVKALVLSSAAGSYSERLMHVTKPTLLKDGVARALGEDGSVTHPMVNLIQQYLDPAEPVNYVRRIVANPPEDGFTLRNVLLMYGQGDSHAPAQTVRALSDAMGLNIIGAPLDVSEGDGFDGYYDAADPENDRVLDVPLTGNIVGPDGQTATQGMTQFKTDGYGGHELLFENEAALQQLSQFLSSFFSTGVAEIAAP